MILNKITINKSNPYKYKIKDLATRNLKINKMSERKFVKDLDISWATYLRDKYIKLIDRKTITEERLQIYAAAFNVELEYLLNYRIVRSAENPPMRPLRKNDFLKKLGWSK